MEEQDRELLTVLRQSHEELDQLMLEHNAFEKQLETMGRRPALTPDDQNKVRRLKKLKLQGRDRIEQILVAHRT